MAELKLIGFGAAGETHELVTQADAENRRAAHEFTNIRDFCLERLRIAGAIGEEDSVRFERQDIFGRGEGRHNGYAAPDVSEPAEDIALNPVVVGDAGMPPGSRRIHALGRGAGPYP